MYYTNNLDDWTGKPRDCALHGGQGRPLSGCWRGPRGCEGPAHSLPTSFLPAPLPAPHGGRRGPLHMSVRPCSGWPCHQIKSQRPFRGCESSHSLPLPRGPLGPHPLLPPHAPASYTTASVLFAELTRPLQLQEPCSGAQELSSPPSFLHWALPFPARLSDRRQGWGLLTPHSPLPFLVV